MKEIAEFVCLEKNLLIILHGKHLLQLYCYNNVPIEIASELLGHSKNEYYSGIIWKSCTEKSGRAYSQAGFKSKKST